MIHHLWFAYFWPSLEGNGPEDLIATVGGTIVGALLWPPARRALHRFVDVKNAELHRKLDHVIFHHPDIPPLPEENK